MTGFLILYGGIAAVVGTITFLDWLGRRQDRRRREHRKTA
jgi:hypothetical protein